MKLDPHISLGFNGQCEAAFRVYERCLDGTIAFMVTWGDSPAAAEAPPGWEAKIYHATLRVGDIALAGGDLPPDRYEPPKGFQILLNMDDPIAAERHRLEKRRIGGLAVHATPRATALRPSPNT